jgi:hypothetical protein
MPKRGRYTNTGENIPNGHKIYQWLENWPSGHKIHITASSIARPFKIFPNWDLWHENIPSGNPAYVRHRTAKGAQKND